MQYDFFFVCVCIENERYYGFQYYCQSVLQPHPTRQSDFAQYKSLNNFLIWKLLKMYTSYRLSCLSSF